MPDLSRLLTPRSVAIVGASPTPGALGNSVLRNLERHGFAGDIHLINPKRDEIDGRPCLPSIDDAARGRRRGGAGDPRPAVLPAVRALAERKASARRSSSRRASPRAARRVSPRRPRSRGSPREHGMVVEGPNCLGLVNYAAGVPLTFVEAPVLDRAGKPRGRRSSASRARWRWCSARR